MEAGVSFWRAKNLCRASILSLKLLRSSLFKDAGLYGAVYLATFLISNMVTNNAAAALVFPIAMDAAETTGADLVLMSYCLMLGASASFMSPFGYQLSIFCSSLLGLLVFPRTNLCVIFPTEQT